jgi:hypothetical protein
MAYSKQLAEHQKRKCAEFEEMARGWVPKKYLADTAVANAPLQSHVYFMILDYLMCTGNVDEVNRFFSYAKSGLERVAKLQQEEDIANN